MCLPKPKTDTSGERARQEEQARQNRIRQGRSRIDDAFGRFDDSFYTGLRTAYDDYYLPQFDRQYQKAREATVFDLSRRGMLNRSSTSDDRFGDLLEHANTQREGIINSGFDEVNRHRSRVSQEKTNLYAQNTAAADPSQANAAALAAVGGLTETPAYSPLGEMFGSFLNSGANYLMSQPYRQGNRGPTYNYSNKGSGRVVG